MELIYGGWGLSHCWCNWWSILLKIKYIKIDKVLINCSLWASAILKSLDKSPVTRHCISYMPIRNKAKFEYVSLVEILSLCIYSWFTQGWRSYSSILPWCASQKNNSQHQIWYYFWNCCCFWHWYLRQRRYWWQYMCQFFYCIESCWHWHWNSWYMHESYRGGCCSYSTMENRGIVIIIISTVESNITWYCIQHGSDWSRI